MTGPTQLETCVGELTTAVKTLTNYSPDIAGGRYHEPEKVQRARRSVLALTSQIQTLIGEPTDFLQHLATQVFTPFYPRAHLYIIRLPISPDPST